MNHTRNNLFTIIYSIFRPGIVENEICNDPNEIEIHKKKFSDYVKFFTRNYLYRLDRMVNKNQ